jgi:hypothetical protein
MNELKTRGVNDVLIAVVDGLKGFPEAIGAVFAQTVVQTPDRGPGQALHHSFDPQLAGLRVLERSQDRYARSEGDLPGGDRRGSLGPARCVRGEMG